MTKNKIKELKNLDWMFQEAIIKASARLPYAGFLPFVSKTQCKKALKRHPYLISFSTEMTQDLQIFSECLCELVNKDSRFRDLLMKELISENYRPIIGTFYVEEALAETITKKVRQTMKKFEAPVGHVMQGIPITGLSYLKLELEVDLYHYYYSNECNQIIIKLQKIRKSEFGTISFDTISECLEYIFIVNTFMSWVGRDNIRFIESIFPSDIDTLCIKLPILYPILDIKKPKTCSDLDRYKNVSKEIIENPDQKLVPLSNFKKTIKKWHEETLYKVKEEFIKQGLDFIIKQ